MVCFLSRTQHTWQVHRVVPKWNHSPGAVASAVPCRYLHSLQGVHRPRQRRWECPLRGEGGRAPGPGPGGFQGTRARCAAHSCISATSCSLQRFLDSWMPTALSCDPQYFHLIAENNSILSIPRVKNPRKKEHPNFGIFRPSPKIWEFPKIFRNHDLI